MKYYYLYRFLIPAGLLLCFAREADGAAPPPGMLSLHTAEVSGQVRDSKGVPLPGVTVSVRGKGTTTMTDDDGRFVTDAEKSDTLVFEKAGYSHREIVVYDQRVFQVILRKTIEELEEVSVVSTGYQTLALEKATGAFEKVNTGLLNRSVGTDVLSRLEGVSSILFDKRIGQSNTLTIRGRSTLFANSAPLVVVDNFPYNGDLNNINPNDVESVTILKDAAASSIWGVRAANGVIVVTTKKGGRGRPLSVNFNANVTVAGKPDAFYLPRLSPSDFIEVEKQLFSEGFYNDLENSYAHTALTPAVELLIARRDGQLSEAALESGLQALRAHDVRDDLEKYWYRKSVNQQYALSLNGGSDKMTYYFSAGYDHDLSALSGKFQRLNLRTANTFYLLKNLQLDVSAYLTDSRTTAGRDEPSSLRGADGRQLYPYASLADGSGNASPVNLDYRGSFVESSQKQGFQDWRYYPLNEAKEVDNRSSQLDLLLNTAMKYTILPGFNLELRYQLESAQTQGAFLHGKNSYYSRNVVNQYTQVNPDSTLSLPVPAGGIMDASDSRLLSHSFRGQLDYSRNWGRGRLSALAGYEYRNDHSSSRTFRDYGYNADIQAGRPVDYASSFLLSNYSYFIDSTIPYLNSYSAIENYNLSYYTNIAYAWDDRYSLSASARKDESNLFGVNANQKGVPLYSAGAAWTASNEAFYHVNWLPYLKIRLSYGYGGNVDNTLAAQSTINYSGQSAVGKQIYAIINNPPNPDLGWEKPAYGTPGWISRCSTRFYRGPWIITGNAVPT